MISSLNSDIRDNNINELLQPYSSSFQNFPRNQYGQTFDNNILLQKVDALNENIFKVYGLLQASLVRLNEINEKLSANLQANLPVSPEQSNPIPKLRNKSVLPLPAIPRISLTDEPASSTSSQGNNNEIKLPIFNSLDTVWEYYDVGNPEKGVKPMKYWTKEEQLRIATKNSEEGKPKDKRSKKFAV